MITPRQARRSPRGILSVMHLCVLHAAAAETAQELARALNAEGCCAEPPVLADFTPVMGAHTGTGLLGVALYPCEGGR